MIVQVVPILLQQAMLLAQAVKMGFMIAHWEGVCLNALQDTMDIQLIINVELLVHPNAYVKKFIFILFRV